MNILLIDDERMEREGIIFLSRRLHGPFTFYQARNGREGLDCMQKTPIDIVIVDIKMPVMGGLEFLEKATKLYPHTKCIIYSAYSEFEYAKEAINFNVLHYIVKPVEEDEFYSVMNRVIETVQKEKQQTRHEIMRRAIRSLALTEEYALAAKNLRGISVLLFLEHPVLGNHFEQMTELTKGVFADCEIFVENEQECIVVLEQNPKDLKSLLQKWMALLSNALGTGCQAMVSSVFSDYEEMKSTLQHARKHMNAGFFTKQNAIVFADEAKNAAYVDYFGQIDPNDLQRNDTAERVAGILQALDNAETYSNFYTKYSLIKRIEQVVNYVEPNLIEQMLAARNLNELKEVAEAIIRQSPRKSDPVEAAKDYIHQYYRNDISIEDIAESVLLTGNYLCALFKKETGSTLVSYLTEYRMQTARRLVAETSMKYSDNAKQVGYRNPSYFNMVFKNYFGCTPSNYRAGER